MASDRPKINSTSLGLALAIIFSFLFFHTIFVLRAYSWQEKGKLSFLHLFSSHLILLSHRSCPPLPSRRCLSRARPGFTFHPVQRAPEKSGGAAAEPLVKTPQKSNSVGRPEARGGSERYLELLDSPGRISQRINVFLHLVGPQACDSAFVCVLCVT